MWLAILVSAALACASAQTPPSRAESHYKLGLTFKDSGQTDKAIAELETALRLRPAYDEAQFLLGLLLQQTGKPDRAITHFRSLLKRKPSLAEAHNWLGVAYLQKNALQEATAEFRRAIALKPDYVRAHNNLGSTLAQAGDLEAGIQALEAGLKYAPDDLQLRLNLGMALRTKGDADAALLHFGSVLKQRPEDAQVLHQVAQTLRQKGDLEAATQTFETALGLDPELREAYYGLGQTLKQIAAASRAKPAALSNPQTEDQFKRGAEAAARDDFATAKALLEKAVENEPSHAESHNLLGFVLGRSGDLPAARTHLTRAIELKPDLSDAHYNLGVALWYSGDKVKAAEELDLAIRRNPAAGEVYSFRGMMFRESGDFTRARQTLHRAIALNSKLPSPYIDLGIVLLGLGQVEQALGQFEAGLNLQDSGRLPDLDIALHELRKTLDKRQEQAEIHNMLGRLLGAAGADSPQVISAFQEAIRLKPALAEAHNNLGLVYTQLGEDEKAGAAFREAIKHAPEYAGAYANLGALLTNIDPVEAVHLLEKAVTLQPSLLKAQYSLALAYGNSPNQGAEKEIEQLRQVITADPAYPHAHFALGRALLRKGKPAEAVTHLRQAVQLSPTFGEARYQLGLALSRIGQQQEGQLEIQKSRELIAQDQKTQLASLDLSEGKAALERGDVDLAIQKLRAVLKVHPQSAEAQQQLGLALARKQKREPLITARPAAADPKQVALFESYIKDGKFKEVEPLLTSYLSQHPDSAWAWYALGYSLFSQHKVGESIRALSRSLELDINNAEAHKVLGRNLMIIGKFDAAQLEFEQAARLSPGSAEIRYNLGKLFTIQDNYQSAKKWFEEAVKLDPEYMEAYDGLAFSLESLSDDNAAMVNYQKAIQINESRKGRFDAPYVNLSAYYIRTDNAGSALALARKAIEVNPNSDRAWFQMAKAHERQGELSAGVDALNRAVSLNPRSAPYYYVLAALYRRLGRTEESRQAIESFSRIQRETSELEKARRQAALQ